MQAWSVRTRLSAIAATAAVLGLGLAAVVAYVATTRALDSEVDQSLSSPPVPAEDGVVNFPSSEEFCGNSEEDQPSLGLYHSQLVWSDGSLCSPTGEELVLPEDPAQMAGETGTIVLRDGKFVSGANARVAEVRLDDGSVLVVGRDLTPIEDIRRVLLFALILVVVLGGIAAWFVGRWAVAIGFRPVSRFVDYAEAVAAAGSLRRVDLAPPPPPSSDGGGDEVDRLAGALAEMTLSLSAEQQRQHQLVADAGHELRTPLSSLRSNVALLRRARLKGRPLADSDVDGLLADLEGQTIELAGLAEDLVQLAADRASAAPTKELRFDECVRRAVERARPRSRHHTITLEAEPWLVRGDPLALERAAVNLLDNALKFSPDGSTVLAVLNQGTLAVTDDGNGIAPEDAQRAFDRFWRAADARAQPGSGLGLAIVAETARIHGGWTELVPAPGGGTTARLHVPGSPADGGQRLA